MAPPTIEQALVGAEGDLPLAAERMGITQAQLLSQLADSPQLQERIQHSLNQQLALRMHQAVTQLLVALTANLEYLEPFEVAKSIASLATLIPALTTNQKQTTQNTTTNLNVTEVVLSMLPQQTRDAVLSMVVPSPPAGQFAPAQEVQTTTNGHTAKDPDYSRYVEAEHRTTPALPSPPGPVHGENGQP